MRGKKVSTADLSNSAALVGQSLPSSEKRSEIISSIFGRTRTGARIRAVTGAGVSRGFKSGCTGKGAASTGKGASWVPKGEGSTTGAESSEVSRVDSSKEN